METQPAEHRPTVFVVDDDPAMRDSLRWLLGSVHLPAECFASGEEFLESFTDDRTGCVLLDVRMPGLSGLQVHERLGERPCSPPVILITGHGDVPMAVRALKAGALDFIVKPFSDQTLLDSVRQALELDSRDRATTRWIGEVGARLERLTAREREVFEIVVDGKANKVIASELGLSQKTVEVHRARVMEKMQAESLPHLVKMAVAVGATSAVAQALETVPPPDSGGGADADRVGENPDSGD